MPGAKPHPRPCKTSGVGKDQEQVLRYGVLSYCLSIASSNQISLKFYYFSEKHYLKPHLELSSARLRMMGSSIAANSTGDLTANLTGSFESLVSLGSSEC